MYLRGRVRFRFLSKAELLKPRICPCGCNRPVIPNPAAMTAKDKPLYYSDACRKKAAKAREWRRKELRRAA